MANFGYTMLCFLLIVSAVVVIVSDGRKMRGLDSDDNDNDSDGNITDGTEDTIMDESDGTITDGSEDTIMDDGTDSNILDGIPSKDNEDTAIASEGGEDTIMDDVDDTAIASEDGEELPPSPVYDRAGLPPSPCEPTSCKSNFQCVDTEEIACFCHSELLKCY